MHSDEKLDTLIKRFTQFPNWEDRYKELMQFGKEFETLDEKFQVDKFKVNGCQSQVWLYPTLKDGKVYFQADSDAVLVKGIVSLIVYAYSDRSPAEILSLGADFIEKLGITEHLSMNRTNGIRSMLKKVQTYAMLFKTLVEKGMTNVDEI
jgi:cysteine desulfuration protein SufE